MSTDFWLQIILAVCAGAGVYAGVRGDLTRAIVKAEQALLDASKAHDRIDKHVENHNSK